jgi:glycine/D-amino acid oxidase-like deaminating enzyme
MSDSSQGDGDADVDIVVIGGGAMGASTAWQLASR